MSETYRIRITGPGMDISWDVSDSLDFELVERVMVKIWRIITERDPKEKSNGMAATGIPAGPVEAPQAAGGTSEGGVVSAEQPVPKLEAVTNQTEVGRNHDPSRPDGLGSNATQQPRDPALPSNQGNHSGS